MDDYICETCGEAFGMGGGLYAELIEGDDGMLRIGESCSPFTKLTAMCYKCTEGRIEEYEED